MRLLKGTDFTSNVDECIASDCDRPNLRQVDRMLDNLVGFTVGEEVVETIVGAPVEGPLGEGVVETIVGAPVGEPLGEGVGLG